MKTAVVIGRFQPFHLGHKHMIEHACDVADRVIIVIGDTGCARTAKDPWTVEERTRMIQQSMPSLGWKANIVSVEDEPYSDEEWAKKVRNAVAAYVDDLESEIVLVGHNKDESSFYLNLFPWPLVEVPQFATGKLSPGEPVRIDATSVRESLFVGGGLMAGGIVFEMMPEPVGQIINEMATDRVERIADEMHAIAQHKRDSESEISRRYGTQASIAADCLLRDQGHVLLIRRKGRVGKGTLALPGGFLDAGETLRQAAIRELKEETGVDLSSVESALKAEALPMFLGDAPGRSQRGRIVTAVFPYFMKGASKRITPVAGDDAEWAGWVSYKDINKLKSEFFSDHWHLIQMELANIYTED